MRRYLFSLMLLIAFFLPTMVVAQTKRALVIGLGTQEDPSWNKINGDKDVPYVMEMLKMGHYQQINTCINTQATKEGIMTAFRNLAAVCQPKDIIYIHYSGHGQQMRDVNDDETDELDECWIPYDAYRRPCANDRGEKHLTDDEVNTLLTDIRYRIGKDGKMLVVVDACHSGDATRGAEDTVRGVTEIFNAVYSYFFPSEANIPVNSKRLSERWITLSACESQQLNIEMKQPSVGKLTYAIYTKVRNGERGDNTSWFRALKKFVNQHSGSRPQRPVMSGETDKYKITDILF